MARKKNYLDFSDLSYNPVPSPYVSPQGAFTHDTSTDPRFKVTSKIPYKNEIVTRTTVWDYYPTTLYLPPPSAVLTKLGKGLEAYDDLLEDARVKACLVNRRAGTMSLKWTIDQNDCPVRMMKIVEKIFEALPIYDIISEILLCAFYGYSVSEVNWTAQDGMFIPESVIPKAPRWFVWSEENELRYRTKVNMVQGEPVPPRKFIVSRIFPSYQDPYSSREAIGPAVYWPVQFRKMDLRYAVTFVEKYAMPWIDVQHESGLQAERLTEVINGIQQVFSDGLIAHPDNTTVTPLAIGDSKSMDNYVAFLDMLNREIDMAILGTNLMTEVKGGSFAAATAHAGVRDDIIQMDSRCVEEFFNQLIEWFAWYNYPASVTRPKFRLYRNYPPSKDRAEIDTMLGKLGVKFAKSYFQRTYGLNQDEIEIGAPEPMLTPGTKGIVAGAVEIPKEQPEDTTVVGASEKTELSANTAETVSQATVEARDPASNQSTKDARIKAKKRGYPY
jgi:hypothetical protein